MSYATKNGLHQASKEEGQGEGKVPAKWWSFAETYSIEPGYSRKEEQ
jgi:hypothetical protein